MNSNPVPHSSHQPQPFTCLVISSPPSSHTLTASQDPNPSFYASSLFPLTHLNARHGSRQLTTRQFQPIQNELHTLLFVPEIGPKSVIVRTLGIGGREFHVDGGNSLVVPQVVHSVATHRVQAGHLPRLSGGVVFGYGAKDVLGGALEGEEG